MSQSNKSCKYQIKQCSIIYFFISAINCIITNYKKQEKKVKIYDKKVAKKFGGITKSSYLCIAFEKQSNPF